MQFYHSEYVACTKEEVLKRISQEEIYLLVLDNLPPVNTYIKSPFREDKNAGSYFLWFNGILYHKDFADPNRQMRDCFQAVMDKTGMTFKETLLFINKTFELGLDSGKSKPILFQNVIINNKINKSIPGKILKIDEKPSDEIIYKARGFFPIDKNYWYNRYEITRNNLIEDNVFPAVWFQFYSKKGQLITIRPADITYGYAGFDNGRVKIYRPLNTEKVGKWITNCKQNDIGGIKTLDQKGDNLYINKAYKDYRIIKNEKLHSIWFQNEGMFPDMNILNDLCLRFNNIIIPFDNDIKGITAGNKLKDIINDIYPNKAKTLFIPERYKNSKDLSDLKYNYGKEEFKKMINGKIT